MCARAPGRAPPGEDPGGAAAGGGRAAPLLPLSGLCGPPRVLPAARLLERAGYLPAIARGGDGGGGRGRAPRSGPAAPFLRLALGFRLVVGGAVAPARSSGAIESGLLSRALSGSACPAAQRLGCRLGPRPRGRPLRRRAWRPPTGESAWSWASWSAGRAGRSRGGWSPPTRCRAPAAAAPTSAHSRRQDSLALVVMVTAAPVNERLSDTRTPVRPEVVRSAPRSQLPETPLRGVLPAQVAVRFQAKVEFQGLGLFLSWTVERCLEN